MPFTRKINPNFQEVTIKLFSPKNILDQSYGEVTLPETKNHRSHKPVEKGLFDQGIFGPEVSWQCACGRYKGIRYKGTTCPKCHVEINHKSVRRERMGHIKESGDTNLVPDAVISRRRFESINKQIKATKVITQPGDTKFTAGQLVPTYQFELENKTMEGQNLQPAEARDTKVATATNIVQGITKQSLNSDSFVANAAFQETIKTLVKATVAGKIDPLNHIKESVILGKPIPAGTGMPAFRDLRVRSKEEERILMEEMRQQQATVAIS